MYGYGLLCDVVTIVADLRNHFRLVWPRDPNHECLHPEETVTVLMSQPTTVIPRRCFRHWPEGQEACDTQVLQLLIYENAPDVHIFAWDGLFVFYHRRCLDNQSREVHVKP